MAQLPGAFQARQCALSSRSPRDTSSVFRDLAGLLDACEAAWNRFAADPDLIRSLCAVAWAATF